MYWHIIWQVTSDKVNVLHISTMLWRDIIAAVWWLYDTCLKGHYTKMEELTCWLWINPRPHTLHLYGRSPVWILMCVLRWSFLLNLREQYWHLWMRVSFPGVLSRSSRRRGSLIGNILCSASKRRTVITSFINDKTACSSWIYFVRLEQ